MCFYLGFLTFASQKHKKLDIFIKYQKNSLFGLLFDPQNGAFSDKKPPGDPQGASQDNPRSPQEPPGSIFKSPGSLLEVPGLILEPPAPIWEPPGSIFEPPGPDFIPKRP